MMVKSEYIDDDDIIPDLVSDGSSSELSSDFEDSDNEDFDDEPQLDSVNEEQINSLITEGHNDRSENVIDIDVFGIDVTEGGKHDQAHLEREHDQTVYPWYRGMNVKDVLLKVNAFIIREMIDKNPHLVSLTAEAASKSLTRRIKTAMMLGSLPWMWLKLLGVPRKEVNTVTTESK